MALLVDSDDAGKALRKGLQGTSEEFDIAQVELPRATRTIEDCLAWPDAFVEACSGFAAEVGGKSEEDGARIAKELQEGTRDGKKKGGLAGVAFRHAKELCGLDQEPSKVGVARAYIERTADCAFDKKAFEKARKLASGTVRELKLSPERFQQDEILGA